MGLDALVLDLENPRFGLIDAADEAEALGLLAARADLRELWNSINERGFERYEPLVGFQRDDGRYIVVEGNRRLAAVKALRDPSLLSGARVTPPPMTVLAEGLPASCQWSSFRSGVKQTTTLTLNILGRVCI